jgi:transposase
MASDELIELVVQLGKRLEKQERQLEVQERRLEAQAKEIKALKEENGQLKQLLASAAEKKGSKAPKFSEDYSVEKHTGKGKSKRGQDATGRRPQSAKLELVERTVDVYEAGVPPAECVARGSQYVWRIEDGRAQYICYRFFTHPDTVAIPPLAGVRNRLSEYGLEVILIVAFLHYWVGISLDHTCAVVEFFTGLALSKSQANSLLTQLSRDWQSSYDSIAELLSYQLVIYIDETGWQVGKESCYTWAFSTAMHVLFRTGVGRSKAEAQAIVGEQFAGIGVSDDYGAYRSLFSEHQLCWAHLLRKAIKLMLQHPAEDEYKRFLDELYRIYQQAVRWQKDQRLSSGRAEKVERLQARIQSLCLRAGTAIDKETMSVSEQTFIRLQNELVKGLAALFVFVMHPQVEPTNNRSERNVRREAEVRKGGRTSKTQTGAKRRGVIMTVLASLNTRFQTFTLQSLLNEIARWAENGISLFQAELDDIKMAHAPPTV